MNLFIGFFIIGIVAIIVVLIYWPDTEDKRKKYLEQFARLVEGKLVPIEGSENAFRIEFRYQGKDFIYEDIEEEGFLKRKYCQGYLRISTGTDLVISFMEKERSSMLESTMKKSGSAWRTGPAATAKKLSCFEIYTNNQLFVDALMADTEIVDTLSGFKNVDNRGHPFMALEILEGNLVLRFYSLEGQKPSLFDLQSNVSAIEGYLALLLKLVNRIQKIYSEKGFYT